MRVIENTKVYKDNSEVVDLIHDYENLIQELRRKVAELKFSYLTQQTNG
jgi:hypothetical protein